MKLQVMLRMRAHLSREILPSLGKMYPVLMNEYEQTVFVGLFSEGRCTVMRHFASEMLQKGGLQS